MTRRKTQIVEQISYEVLLRNRKNTDLASRYHTRLFYELEAQRQRNRESITSALLSHQPFSTALNDWCRVVDYMYSDTPLSMVGSLNINGGRFNIGEDLNPNIVAFPALYIGDSHDTALNERFPSSHQDNTPLTRNEFNLICNSASYSVINLVGNVENVFDLSNKRSCKPFMDTISKFRVSKRTQSLASQARISTWKVLKEHEALQKMCLEYNFRTLPNLFDIPAPSQILGQLVRNAGLAGIRYPSTKSAGYCLALFPENFNDASVVTVEAPPTSLKLTSISNNNWKQHLE